MPSILLIRHAQASFGTEDYDVLSEHGHTQVRALVAGLEVRGVRADRVVSGGLRRQRDTAGPLAAAMGVEVEIDPRWDEYSDRDILGHHARVPAGLEHHAGDVALSSREFQNILDGALRAWINAGGLSPCAETWPAFRERVTGALRDLAGSLGKGQTGLAVSSGGVIAALSAGLMALPSDALTTLNHVSINASITKLAVGRGGVTVVSINEHGHLERASDSLVTYR